MQRVNLIGGSYATASQAVAAQSCINLIPEPIPQQTGEPVQFADLPAPGLRTFARLTPAEVRGHYTTSSGDLVVVAGSVVYQVLASGAAVVIGTISSTSGQVRMADNALVLLIVDGTAAGYTATLPAAQGGAFGALEAITDPAFYGSRTIAVLDTYFILSQPEGGQWYVLPSNYLGNSTPIDPLYVASLTSRPQATAGVAVVGQSLWVLGAAGASEIWYDAGLTDFPFQRYAGIAPGPGCEAPYSIAADSQRVFWLGADQVGHARVYLGYQNQTTPCSTFAVERALADYGDLSGAIGHIYQQGGHIFYVLTVAAANATWVYDASTELWHQRVSTGGRVRANCWAAAYDQVFCGDYATGQVYAVSPNYPDEDGTLILRQRSFPHIVTSGTRARHQCFGVDMQTTATLRVLVDWSDDRGVTFGAQVLLEVQPGTTDFARLWRLGIARDRVYRLSWADPGATALLGAFIDLQPVLG